VLVSGTIGFRLRKLTPLQEGVFHSIGYGYRSLKALQGLFYPFASDVLARELHELYLANLIEISAESKEVTFSHAMVLLLEATLQQRQVTLEVDEMQANQQVLVVSHYRQLTDLLEQLGIEAPGELVTKIEVVIVRNEDGSGIELEYQSRKLEAVSQELD
jgi:hypothetical protein